MRDVMSEHADRVAQANKALLEELEEVGSSAKTEIAALLAALAEVGSDTLRRVKSLTESVTLWAAEALTKNLMAVAASEAALRSALDERLAFLDTGRLPNPDDPLRADTPVDDGHVQQEEAA